MSTLENIVKVSGGWDEFFEHNAPLRLRNNS